MNLYTGDDFFMKQTKNIIMSILIRFKDLYAIAHDPSGSNCSWNKIDLLCANIQGDEIHYLKPLKYEYYDVSDEPFNCMLYEKDKFESFNLEIPYSLFYENMIYLFIKSVYERCKQDKIIFVYDDVVINTYGQDLYYNSIETAMINISCEFNIRFQFEFKHIADVAPGEFIASEVGSGCRGYGLYNYEHKKSYTTEVNQFKRLVDKRVFNKEDVKYPYETYLVDREIEKYGFKPLKYFTLVDINAYSTIYYTYSMKNGIIEFCNTDYVCVGLMSIVEWIYKHSEKKQDIYFKLKKIFGDLYSIPQYGLHDSTYGINITAEEFYDESPIDRITRNLCNIKRKILNEHKFCKKIIHRYNIESLSELHLKHPFLKLEIFNGQCTKLLESYRFLKDALENNLVFTGNMSSEQMVDRETGKSHYEVKIKLSDYGYEYKYDIDTSFELFKDTVYYDAVMEWSNIH